MHITEVYAYLLILTCRWHRNLSPAGNLNKDEYICNNLLFNTQCMPQGWHRRHKKHFRAFTRQWLKEKISPWHGLVYFVLALGPWLEARQALGLYLLLASPCMGGGLIAWVSWWCPWASCPLEAVMGVSVRASREAGLSKGWCVLHPSLSPCPIISHLTLH